MRCSHELTLPRDRTALVLVDFQERLFPAMDQARQEETRKNVALLLDLARVLRLPVLYTEQYPAGLGKTIPEVSEKLPEGAAPFEKVEFSGWRAEGFSQQFRYLGMKAAILAGMESHVCVLGTVLDMLQEGICVHVPADAVVSRTESNRQTGLALMDRAGAVVTSTETVIFQLLGRAGTPEFKTMSKLLK
jgi:nicotinamidase-related amidase